MTIRPTMLNRRQFLATSAASAAASLFAAPFLHGAADELPVIGQLKVRPSIDIQASRLSVGYETLDRKHFDPEKTLPWVSQLGVKWARVQTGWLRCEPEKGKFDFAWLDAVVDPLLKAGIQPWFNLGYGNKLYTPEADATAVGWAPIFTDEAKEGWLRFVDKISAHYAGRIKHWELWNEPNITNFWKPKKPDAASYVELVKMTAPIIRKNVDKSFLIGAALAGMPHEYLKKCMEAGLGDFVDAISYHPYRNSPEGGNYAKEVRAFRELLDQHKKGLALWQGENGAPSKAGGAGALSKAEWNEDRQAKWLTRRIVYDLMLGLDLTSYFLIVDLVGYRGSTNWKGLLRGTEYTPKPSFFAYQRLCSLLDAQATPGKYDITIKGGADGKSLIHGGFVRNGKVLTALWEAADLFKPFTPGKVELVIKTGPDAALDQPVLIDPLIGNIHRLDAVKKDGNTVTISNVPVWDFPLLIADKSLVL